MPSVSSSLTVVYHISKGFSFFSSESADTRTKMAQKKIANEDEARRREATVKLKGEVSEAEVSVQVTPTRWPVCVWGASSVFCTINVRIVVTEGTHCQGGVWRWGLMSDELSSISKETKLPFAFQWTEQRFPPGLDKVEVYLKVFGPRSLPVFHQLIRDLRCEQDIRVMTGVPDSG